MLKHERQAVNSTKANDLNALKKHHSSGLKLAGICQASITPAAGARGEYRKISDPPSVKPLIPGIFSEK
jgi:hypothetical protein